MTARRLVLLRHGRTAWNSTGRAQGVHDIELDELGHRQAAVAAASLAALEPAALWTSDLARARATAGYLERVTGLSAKVDERLREYDVGARQGMTSAEFEAAFPDAYASWLAGDDLVRVPGSETAPEVAARIVPALNECLGALCDRETGVVVTHGASLKVGLLGLLGWPLAQAQDLRGMDNCGWVTLAEGAAGRFRLASYNQRVGPAGDGAVDL